jgi:hypothetical protein
MQDGRGSPLIQESAATASGGLSASHALRQCTEANNTSQAWGGRDDGRRSSPCQEILVRKGVGSEFPRGPRVALSNRFLHRFDQLQMHPQSNQTEAVELGFL